MTDNRTTELREKLDKRGVDYVIVDFGDASNVLTWVSSGAAWYYVEEQQRLFGESVTPEQAIAATLGGEKPYYTDRDDNGNHITCAQCGEYLGTAEEFAAMAGEKRCFATDYTHERCKYSVDRGWVEDVELGSGTCKRIAELEQLVRDMYREHPIYYFEQWMEDHGIEVES